jgi:hypothetical protein
MRRPRLDDIPWEKLRQSNGTSENVPIAISRLTATEEHVRTKAYWNLENSVVLQSQLYEAAPYVVPFMADLIERREYPGNLLAYKLLYEIANGWTRDDVTSEYWLTAGPKRRMPLTQASRLVVLSYTDLYERDARQDQRTRHPAIELLHRMSEYSQDAADRLNSMKASDDPEVRSAIFQVIAENE